jgi:hypothetical protein
MSLVLAFLAGLGLGAFYILHKEKKNRQMLAVLTKKYFEEEWLATGSWHTRKRSGKEYIVAEFAKPLLGPGLIMADEREKVWIPIDGSGKPEYNEFFRIRLRSKEDPLVPDHSDIGSFLYAESTGRYQAR